VSDDSENDIIFRHQKPVTRILSDSDDDSETRENSGEAIMVIILVTLQVIPMLI
jgi:hypothetical protein